MSREIIIAQLEARMDIMIRLGNDGREYNQHWQEFKLDYESIRHEPGIIPRRITEFYYDKLGFPPSKNYHNIPHKY